MMFNEMLSIFQHISWNEKSLSPKYPPQVLLGPNLVGHFLPKFPQIFENAWDYNSGMVGDMKKTLYKPIFTLVPGYAEPKSQICSFRDKKVTASDSFLTFLAVYNLYVKILLRYLTWWIVGAFRFFWPILVQCARIRVKLRPKMRFLDFTVIKWYLVTTGRFWSHLVTTNYIWNSCKKYVF